MSIVTHGVSSEPSAATELQPHLREDALSTFNVDPGFSCMPNAFPKSTGHTSNSNTYTTLSPDLANTEASISSLERFTLADHFTIPGHTSNSNTYTALSPNLENGEVSNSSPERFILADHFTIPGHTSNSNTYTTLSPDLANTEASISSLERFTLADHFTIPGHTSNSNTYTALSPNLENTEGSISSLERFTLADHFMNLKEFGSPSAGYQCPAPNDFDNPAFLTGP
ncbi:MAG: hypothetical protein LQ337_007277 [Flavoplaca oasis]|nr:MAG: hypothetical protein LQ337_007277 [Flavoplaca oasis]